MKTKLSTLLLLCLAFSLYSCGDKDEELRDQNDELHAQLSNRYQMNYCGTLQNNNGQYTLNINGSFIEIYPNNNNIQNKLNQAFGQFNQNNNNNYYNQNNNNNYYNQNNNNNYYNQNNNNNYYNQNNGSARNACVYGNQQPSINNGSNQSFYADEVILR